MTILLVVLLSFHAIYATKMFMAYYDAAIANYDKSAYDLTGKWLTYSGGVPIKNGLNFPTDNSYWRSSVDSFVSIETSWYDSATIMVAINSESCNKGYFLIWLWADSDGETPRCGLGCVKASTTMEFEFVCISKNSQREASTFKVQGYPNIPTVYSLGFTNNDGKIGMNLFVKPKGMSTLQYTYISRYINYDDFFEDTKLSFKSVMGNLYYLAFIAESIDTPTFEKFSLGGNPDTEGINCPDCIGAPENLQCESGETARVLNGEIRQFYCPCSSGGYDPKTNKCIPVVTECKIPCWYGCNSQNTTQCYRKCPAEFYTYDVIGDFVDCQCPEGGVYETTISGRKNWCFRYKDQMSEMNAKMSTTTIVIIVISISVFIFVIGIIVYCCCKAYHVEEDVVPHEVEEKEIVLKAEDIHVGTECKVCYSPDVSLVVLIPCGHASICKNCVKKLKACPFCRNAIKKYDSLQKYMKLYPQLKATENSQQLDNKKPANIEFTTFIHPSPTKVEQIPKNQEKPKSEKIAEVRKIQEEEKIPEEVKINVPRVNPPDGENLTEMREIHKTERRSSH